MDWGITPNTSGDLKDRSSPGSVAKKYVPGLSSSVVLTRKYAGVCHYEGVPTFVVGGLGSVTVMALVHELGHSLAVLPDQFPTGAEIVNKPQYDLKWPCFMNDMRKFEYLCLEYKQKFQLKMSQFKS